jgi:transcriptional regulator with GAF, ATPase, and Fis domain
LRDTKLALETAFAQIKMLQERLYNEILALREEVEWICMFEEIVGASPVLRAVLSRVSKVSILGLG